MQVLFRDGSATEKVTVEYPAATGAGRGEGIPLLLEKFNNAVAGHFSGARKDAILSACADRASLEKMTVNAFMDLWVSAGKG